MELGYREPPNHLKIRQRHWIHLSFKTLQIATFGSEFSHCERAATPFTAQALAVSIVLLISMQCVGSSTDCNPSDTKARNQFV